MNELGDGPLSHFKPCSRDAVNYSVFLFPPDFALVSKDHHTNQSLIA